MRTFWLAVLVVSAGCASTPKVNPDLAAMEGADAKVLEGCYDCLIEARTTYVRLAAGKSRPSILPRLFEVELLLILREKELAMDFSTSLARARDLINELPPALDAPRYLTIVEGIPSDDVGTPRAEDTSFRRGQGPLITRIDNELAWLRNTTAAAPPPGADTAGGRAGSKAGAGSRSGGKAAAATATPPTLRQPVRQYLALALDCMYGFRARSRPPGTPPPPPVNRDPGPTAPPLLTYRFGICGSVMRAPIENVRSDPRFAEAAFFLARLEVAERQHSKVRPLLEEAYKRFPTSPSVTYFNGSFNQLAGDCRAALGFYDETIALKIRHENALLGRTICLTHLKRTDDAIQAATHLINLRLDNVADGFYWRARNYHFIQQLEVARRDIESAKALRSSGEIHTLAGIIEYDQNDLTIAERDLNIAKSLSGGADNCTARWYLGLVFMKREKWLDSATDFEDSMNCYQRAVKENEVNRDAIANNDNLDPEFKKRQIAGFEAAIEEDSRQQFASAFNAANHFAAGGNRDKAKVLIEVAAKDPNLADRVKDLRRILGGG
jgi:tetratricopeptide (TPR) repeat protein